MSIIDNKTNKNELLDETNKNELLDETNKNELLDETNKNELKKNSINKILIGENYILNYESKPKFVNTLKTIKE